jgi:hypothetical protein
MQVLSLRHRASGIRLTLDVQDAFASGAGTPATVTIWGADGGRERIRAQPSPVDSIVSMLDWLRSRYSEPDWQEQS